MQSQDLMPSGKQTTDHVPLELEKIPSRVVDSQATPSDFEPHVHATKENSNFKRSSTSCSSEEPIETGLFKRKKYSNSKHKNGIQAILDLKLSWIITKTERNSEGENEHVLYCRLCKKHNVLGGNCKGSWVHTAYKFLRKDKILAHGRSEQHAKAVQLELEEQQQDIKCSNALDSDVKCVEAMMEIVRYIAQKNHALDEFSSLVNLNVSLGSTQLQPIRDSSRATYGHPESVHSLLETLSASVDNWILPQMQDSMVYSLTADEVSDSASWKNLAIIIKYIDPQGNSVIKFLANKKMTRSTGSLIKETIMDTLKEKNLVREKCKNLTSDGGSNFAGKHNGAAALLQKEMGDVIVLHCHDHRLALAVKEAFADVKHIDKVSEGLEKLYKYYKYSTVSSSTLVELQDAFHKAHFKAQQAKHHRWLSHDKAVLTVLKGHTIFLQDLENACVSGDITSDRKSETEGLISWLTSELVIKTLALLGDTLPHLSELSLLFQRRNVDLGNADSILQKTIKSLKKLERMPGYWGRKVEKNMFLTRKTDCDDKKFEKVIKLPFLSSLKEKIEERFHNAEVISSLSTLSLPIFETDLLNKLPVMYRENHIQELANFFHMEDDNEEGSTVQEWCSFIEWLKTMDLPSNSKCSSSIPHISKMFFDAKDTSESLRILYPKIAFLYSVASTLTLSSAEVERVFSHLKLIKTDRRSSLSAKTLNEILNIKLNIDDDQWPEIRRKAAVAWLMAKKRRLCS